MLGRQDGCQGCEEVLCVLLVMEMQRCRPVLSSLGISRPLIQLGNCSAAEIPPSFLRKSEQLYHLAQHPIFPYP